MEQLSRDLRNDVHLFLYLYGPPLSFLQTRATREYELCERETFRRLKLSSDAVSDLQL